MDKPLFPRPSELPSSARHFDEAIYSRLTQAREFISDCYDQPLDLQQISRQAFFSPYHFLRLFRCGNWFSMTQHLQN